MPGCINGKPWTDWEIAWLRQHFATADWRLITETLTTRTSRAIIRKAYDLGLRRPWEGRAIARVEPLFAELRRLRKELGLSQAELGRKSGHHKDKLRKYELGRLQPTFWTVRDWAQALGFEIVLEPVAKRISAAPQQMRGGR